MESPPHQLVGATSGNSQWPVEQLSTRGLPAVSRLIVRGTLPLWECSNNQTLETSLFHLCCTHSSANTFT
ncbi:hypothetical protein SERLA73DRAFT_180277, partial [Serpula lacrymans var. lacrymans S7.3]